MSVQGKISDYYLPCPALTYDCGHNLPLGPGMFVELQSVGRDCSATRAAWRRQLRYARVSTPAAPCQHSECGVAIYSCVINRHFCRMSSSALRIDSRFIDSPRNDRVCVEGS